LLLKRIAFLALPAVMALVLLGGCGYRGAPDATQQVPPAKSQSAVIRDFAFSPATLTVRPGAVVTWVNEDSVTHTVTGKDLTAVTLLPDNPSAIPAGRRERTTVLFQSIRT